MQPSNTHLFVRAVPCRIEDTDTARSTRESEEKMKADLAWLGLNWDEGEASAAAAALLAVAGVGMQSRTAAAAASAAAAVAIVGRVALCRPAEQAEAVSLVLLRLGARHSSGVADAAAGSASGTTAMANTAPVQSAVQGYQFQHLRWLCRTCWYVPHVITFYRAS
jgi:hypothetical protein